MAPIRIRTFTVHAALKFAFLALIFAGILAYGTYQARALIAGPMITLHSPETVIADSASVTITGVARNITSITLNGRPIHTDEAGTFTEPIILQSGHTIVTLTGKDRYGRTTRITRSYVFNGDALEERT